MVQRSKNTALIIVDFIMVIVGIILIPTFFLKWKSIGFEFNTTLEASRGVPLNDGNAFFMMILLGIALICYAVIDFLVFRIKRENKKINYS